MALQVFHGSQGFLARPPGQERVSFTEIFQPLVIHGGGEVPFPGQGQADPLHVFGQRTPVRVDQHRGELSLPIRVTGQPVESELVPVKKDAFPVNSRDGFKGMDQEIIRLASGQERKEGRKEEEEF
jgi:hypothetical protein